MQSEVTVTIKGDEATFKLPFIYEGDQHCNDKKIKVDLSCPILQDCVQQTKDRFKGEIEEIIVKITTRWYP